MATGLALGLGVVFIVAGLAETYRAVSSGDGGVVFWFGSLRWRHVDHHRRLRGDAENLAVVQLDRNWLRCRS